MLKGVVFVAAILCLACSIAFGSELVLPSSHKALAQDNEDLYQGPIPEDNTTDNNPDDAENGPIVEDNNNFTHNALDQNYNENDYEYSNGNSQKENSNQAMLSTNTHYDLPIQINI